MLRGRLESHELLAREKRITIEEECDVSGVIIVCDRERIEQVFANLLGNALKFSRAGDTMFVRGKRDDARVRYEFEDTGPGIPADVLPHIFEPYWSTGDHAKEAWGLGLALHLQGHR